jgi:hypothetical protein
MAQPNANRVLAIYPDLEAARGAMRSLEGSGIDAEDIQLLGAPVDHAAAVHDVSGRDRNVSSWVGRRAATGAVVGAVIGLVLGLLIGAVANGPAVVFALVGVIFLGGLGFVIAGYASLDAKNEWELTFQPDEFGQVAVGVESTDPAELDKAERALSRTHPLKVERP